MGLAAFMNRLPTVISCCFCCFLKAGNILISIFSFIVGLIFAPNMAQAKGFWDMDVILSNYSAATEGAVQIVLGLASVMLCIMSLILLVGICCNLPSLILIYQWGAVIYASIVSVLFLVLIVLCFFVHSNCLIAGGMLCLMLILLVGSTAYFLIVTNSLRVSLTFLSPEDYKSVL